MRMPPAAVSLALVLAFSPTIAGLTANPPGEAAAGELNPFAPTYPYWWACLGPVGCLHHAEDTFSGHPDVYHVRPGWANPGQDIVLDLIVQHPCDNTVRSRWPTSIPFGEETCTPAKVDLFIWDGAEFAHHATRLVGPPLYGRATFTVPGSEVEAPVLIYRFVLKMEHCLGSFWYVPTCHTDRVYVPYFHGQLEVPVGDDTVHGAPWPPV